MPSFNKTSIQTLLKTAEGTLNTTTGILRSRKTDLKELDKLIGAIPDQGGDAYCAAIAKLVTELFSLKDNAQDPDVKKIADNFISALPPAFLPKNILQSFYNAGVPLNQQIIKAVVYPNRDHTEEIFQTDTNFFAYTNTDQPVSSIFEKLFQHRGTRDEDRLLQLNDIVAIRSLLNSKLAKEQTNPIAKTTNEILRFLDQNGKLDATTWEKVKEISSISSLELATETLDTLFVAVKYASASGMLSQMKSEDVLSLLDQPEESVLGVATEKKVSKSSVSKSSTPPALPSIADRISKSFATLFQSLKPEVVGKSVTEHQHQDGEYLENAAPPLSRRK